MKTIFLCCAFLVMVLTMTACNEDAGNTIPEYPAESEYSIEADLPTGESDLECPYGGMFDVWTDTTQELGVDFLEQRADSIERVVIFINPFQGKTFYITERSEIERIYYILTETIVTFVNMYPNYMQAIRGDVEFLISLEYFDGTVDEILPHSLAAFKEADNVIVRKLDVRRDNVLMEDIGFIIGVNERIWDFIGNLTPYEPLIYATQELDVDFVTQPVENVERIVVMLDWRYRKNIYVTNQSQIEHIYNLLEETVVTRVVEHPGHSGHPITASWFIITIEYQNGDVDEIHTAENPDFILRLLDTRGRIGDPGFVFGRNERLWEYIFGLSDDFAYHYYYHVRNIVKHATLNRNQNSR